MKKLTKDEMVSEYDSAICVVRMGIWTILLHVRLVREVNQLTVMSILSRMDISIGLIMIKREVCGFHSVRTTMHG